MYYIIDKASSVFYGKYAFVSYDKTKKDDNVVLFAGLAKGFRTEESAKKFINKMFTNVDNYAVISDEKK